MAKRKLPFKCKVGYKPVEIANRFTGEKVTVPADAVAVYDVIMGSNLMAEQSGTSPKKQDELYKTVRKGLDWFMKHEPKAYMVLLD